MKRYPLKFRLSTYQECSFYELSVIGRRAVAPGERLSRLVADIRFTTATFANANLTPCLAQIWAFYVPWRIVWDDWVDFISLSDTITTVPTTTQPAETYLEGGAVGARSALFRRAYKLAYNQYFGDQSIADAWFEDPNDDTDTSLGCLLIWDQFRSKLKQGPYTSEEYLAPVVGTDAVVNLDDLSRSLRFNRSRRKQKMTGDKYVDTMRLMGVELDWRVQMAPEFLGSSQQVLHGEEVSSTFPDVNGAMPVRNTRWSGQMQLMLKRRLAFAEHGTLMVLAGFRPLMGQAASIPDSFMTGQSAFYRPDTVGGPFDEFGTSDLQRFGRYLSGRNTIGLNQDGNCFVDVTGEGLYPPPGIFVPVPDGGLSNVSMQTDLAIAGLTPVPSGRA